MGAVVMGTGGDVQSRSMDAVQDEIVAEMGGLQDAMARYEYLVRLGRGLAFPEEGIRTEENALAGCQSRVWMRGELRDGHLHLAADSDAMITRGIIALLLRVLDDRPPREVLDADLYFLDRTGLRTHLSPSRANGLAAMVKRIRSLAEGAAQE